MQACDAILGSLRWLHHASFRIESAGKLIYLDPYKIQAPQPADLIFISHGHSDHFSPVDIAKIAKPGTLVVCPESMAHKVRGVKILGVRPGMDFEVEGVRGRAVASYNLRKPLHPKRRQDCGYILDLPEGRLYHAGDTDFIDEMAGFQGLDVALLPVGRILFFSPTMGPDQAAQAVALMRPARAVPMHYGMLPGSKGDGQRFKEAVGEGAVILPQEEPL